MNHEPRLHALQQRLFKVAELLETSGDSLGDGKKTVVRAQPQHPGTRDSSTHKLSKSDMLHDVRVACRRAETALRACRRLLTHKQATWFRDQMRALRDRCNPLRDDEVFRKWLEQQPAEEAQERLLKSISESIRNGRLTVADEARAVIKQHHFRRHIQELSSSEPAVRGGEQTKDEPQWRMQAGKWLFQLQDQFVQAIPDLLDDYDGLHQLRIAAKKLRYGLEFAAELDSSLALGRPIRRLQTMQDKLGDLHDAVVRLERLQSEGSKKMPRDRLIAAAQKELQASIARWQRWWQPTTLKQLISHCTEELCPLLICAEY